MDLAQVYFGVDVGRHYIKVASDVQVVQFSVTATLRVVLKNP